MKNPFPSWHPWYRVLGTVVVAVSTLVLPSCGEDNASGLPNVPRAVIAILVDPSPVIGEQNTVTGTVLAPFDVLIVERAGLGGTVNFVNSTVFDPETGAEVGASYFDSSDLIVFEGTDRIEPGGELVVSARVNYVLSELRVDAYLSVAVQFLDDRGNVSNRTLLVEIVPPSADLPG